GPIPGQQIFPPQDMHLMVISGISPGFPELSQSQGQVTHVLLTRSPLTHTRKHESVRLACVKHAASVRPEPGSNSPQKNSFDNLAESSRRGSGQRQPLTQSKWHRKLIDTLLSSQKTDTQTETLSISTRWLLRYFFYFLAVSGFAILSDFDRA